MALLEAKRLPLSLGSSWVKRQDRPPTAALHYDVRFREGGIMADLRAYCDRRRRDDVGWTRSKTFQLMKGLTSSLAPLPPLEAEDAGDKMSLPGSIPGTKKKVCMTIKFPKIVGSMDIGMG